MRGSMRMRMWEVGSSEKEQPRQKMGCNTTKMIHIINFGDDMYA